MDSKKAWEIVKEYSCRDALTENDSIFLEEALNYVLTEALIQNEKYSFPMWQTDIEAGSYNLADYYEKIGKYDLALKYYMMSVEYGCSFARKNIDRIKKRI